MVAPLPPNEDVRLEWLRRYRILDTATERVFDELTHLAATICEAPVSLLSLVDTDRQWFKSTYGFDEKELPREDAFCAHAILGAEIMVVEDAKADPRFVRNPLVTGRPHIRFYAGAPITVGPDLHLGSLCVIDSKPRRLDERQLEALSIIRRSVVAHMELRRSQKDLESVAALLPMCAWCRRIKVSEGPKPDWEPLHRYVERAVTVTHGICPDCSAQKFTGAPSDPSQG